MERFENLGELKLDISKTYKIKQDQRNNLKDKIEEAITNILISEGLEVSKVGKEIAFKLDNNVTRLPNGYVPVKIAVSIPSVDYDIDFERKFYLTEIARKEAEKVEKLAKKAAKIERDKNERAKQKALKEAQILSSEK